MRFNNPEPHSRIVVTLNSLDPQLYQRELPFGASKTFSSHLAFDGFLLDRVGLRLTAIYKPQ